MYVVYITRFCLQTGKTKQKIRTGYFQTTESAKFVNPFPNESDAQSRRAGANALKRISILD